MKKPLAFILLVCYFVVTSGVVVNSHYCMNRLASTELFVFKGDKCGKCGMNIHKSHGCCHDEVKVVKMQNDQQPTISLAFYLPSLDAAPAVISDFISTSYYNVPVDRPYHNHSPPLLTEQDTYLRNRVFRI